MSLIKRNRPSPAMIVAALALCFAMVGTAVAGDSVSKLTKAKVKAIAKKQADKRLKANVPGSHVNIADTATNATTANNANNLGGAAASDYQRYTGNIPSGKTVTGAFGDIGAPGAGGGAAAFQENVIQFTVPAPTALTSANVNFAAGGTSGAVGADDDATCTGSATAPSAPAGKVCLYAVGSYTGTGANTIDGAELFPGQQSRFGFRVESAAGSAPFAGAVGVWAYTAP
jgi:hypothetical protein